jgi:hypothetical protein
VILDLLATPLSPRPDPTFAGFMPRYRGFHLPSTRRHRSGGGLWRAEITPARNLRNPRALKLRHRPARDIDALGENVKTGAGLVAVFDNTQSGRALRSRRQEPEFAQDINNRALDAFFGLYGVDVSAEQEGGNSRLCPCATQLVGPLTMRVGTISWPPAASRRSERLAAERATRSFRHW